MIQRGSTRLKKSIQELRPAKGAGGGAASRIKARLLFFFFFCLNHYILATNLVCWPTLKSDIWPIKGSEFSICCSTLSRLPHIQQHVRASAHQIPFLSLHSLLSGHYSQSAYATSAAERFAGCDARSWKSVPLPDPTACQEPQNQSG